MVSILNKEISSHCYYKIRKEGEGAGAGAGAGVGGQKNCSDRE